MAGKLRPAVIAASALALLVIASPVAVHAGPLAVSDVAAATSDSKHGSKGNDHHGMAATATVTPNGTAAADQGSAAPAADQGSAAPAAAPPPSPAPRSVATGSTAASGSGTRSLPAQIQLSRPRGSQPSERADHASAASRGLHVGAGDDLDGIATNSLSLTASTVPASSGAPATGTPTAGTLAAATAAAAKTSTNHSGGIPTPPPVAVEPPAAPQPNPPLSTQPALTGARMEWVLVGIVVALAAAVVAAVRVATLRGRRPPR